jgi:hypothetical protein
MNDNEMVQIMLKNDSNDSSKVIMMVKSYKNSLI